MMGEKAKVKETVRLYTKLWQLPSFGGIVSRLALAIVVVALIQAILKTATGLGMTTAFAFLEYSALYGGPVGIGIG